MTIYISGPITGLPDRNKKEFQKAEKQIKAFPKSVILNEKLKVINPVKLGYKLDMGFSIFNKEPAWEDYMKVCIKELCKADCVFLLEGWGNSEGAVMEKYIAERLKIPCVENMKELSKIVMKRS